MNQPPHSHPAGSVSPETSTHLEAARTGAPAPAPGRPLSGPSRQVHLFDRLAVVLKYHKIVLIIFVLVVSGMMYQTYTTTPMYQASARLHIEEEYTADVANLRESYYAQDPDAYYNTQYRILQGRDLGRRAVKRLSLAAVPEFNGTGATPTKLSQITGAIKAALLAPFTGGEDPGDEEAELALDPEPESAPGEDTAPEDDDTSGLVDAFLARVDVEPVPSSRLVDVSFVSADPEFAARAANVLAEEYVAQNLDFRLQNTNKDLDFLEQEVARQQAKVQESERLLADYRETRDAVSLDDRQNIVVSRLNQLNDAVTLARTTRIQRETMYNQVANARDRESLTAIVQNPLIQNLRARLAELRRDKARLSERYGEMHPEILRVDSQIADTERQIDAEVDRTVDAIRNDYEAALAEERSLTRDLDQQKGAVEDLGRKSVDYSVLLRQAESDRQIYDSLLARLQELRVVGNSRANNVRLLDRARVPGGPFTPDTRRAWMMALMLGLGLGIGAAFAIDYLDDTVKTPEDITWRLKLNYLGLVPKVRGGRNPMLSGPVPHDFGEAFRALRTALVLSHAGQHAHIQVFTSAQPLEGKTTTAVNVALALAIGGSRVLLIDADMRRPSVHKQFNLTNDKGLSHLLSGQAKMRDVVRNSPDQNLLVITGGATPPNPSELLASDTMKRFLRQLETGPFAWIIIDTPPVLAVTDAVILAPSVAGVTFVLGAEMTRWRLAERAIDTLQAGRPRSVSAILNRVDTDSNRYYYSRYYGQHFRSYYADSQAAS
ncbi:MAG: polysaccharide biosynthesis tyrosine autokinase [Acidimicrobiia bacterium]|nr:polysaccharide biosynthesis tyrosine autokinase [Acidimicrobiia bacterium]